MDGKYMSFCSVGRRDKVIQVNVAPYLVPMFASLDFVDGIAFQVRGPYAVELAYAKASGAVSMLGIVVISYLALTVSCASPQL